MSGGFILPLVVGMAFVVAMGVILDRTSTRWRVERLTQWPFRDMPATNTAIVVCLLVFAIVAVGLLSMRVWPA